MSIDANLKLIGHLYSTRNLFSLLGLAGHNDKLKFFGHIGKALGVDAVLEGYIQRDGDRIRATARLVNVRDGSQLWAGRFDDSFTNVFSVQDSISAQVAHSLSPALVSDEKQALTKRHTANTEAYLEYLKGRHFWNKRTAESLGSSIENFQKAIELDPNYALAYAGLADAYALLVWNIGPVNPELINKARTAARKALELDFTLAEAHTRLHLPDVGMSGTGRALSQNSKRLSS